MQMQKELIKARAVIPIFYSTVTNTAKKTAFQTQSFLEKHSFIPTVTNIGDVDYEDFLAIEGPIILIASTYGNGNSPADGEAFVEWLEYLENNTLLSKMEFSILGLGNRTFEHFAGNSRKIKEKLIALGAKEFHQIVLCNSSSETENVTCKFNEWCTGLSDKLIQKFQLKEMEKGELLQKYKIVLSEEEPQKWEEQFETWKGKLGKDFINYWGAKTSQVIHMQELRKKNDGRSTLWIRCKIPEGFELDPACNINVYPQNVRVQGEETFKQTIRIEGAKKVPYPPMQLEELWKLSNFNQFSDINALKNALRNSSVPEEIKKKYQEYADQPEKLQKEPIRCTQIYEDLKPGIDFIVNLGINSVRPYTLASWQPQKGYFDLAVALDPKGLTSNYFRSKPSLLKIQKLNSTFYIPQDGKPIVMIANGSGISPFRSLVQFYASRSEAQRPKLFLYYGIQDKDNDYYFREEWEAYEKAAIVKIRLAESRSDPNNKVYIQNLIKEDKIFIKEHLFDNDGVIFICGSSGMAKSVDTQIFESIKLKQKIPFKAFKLVNQLAKQKAIVKQVFE